MKLGTTHKCKKMSAALLLMTLFASYSAHSNAQRPWPIITFTCDKNKNEVKLKNEVKWGIAGKNFPFNTKKGTYNPWDLITFENRNQQRYISEKSQLNLSCKLDGFSYRFLIRPKIFNANTSAKCGDRLSVMVSVFKNNELLLENKAMEAFCNGNAPVLRGIKIQGGQGKIKLYNVPRSRFY